MLDGTQECEQVYHSSLLPLLRMEDDQWGDGDTTADPRLQEGAHQIHRHHLPQA